MTRQEAANRVVGEEAGQASPRGGGRRSRERNLGLLTTAGTLHPSAPESAWAPAPGQSPVTVAMAYLQRRLLVAAARAEGSTGHRDVERRLGRGRDNLRAVWDGGDAIQLEDALAIALAYDVPLHGGGGGRVDLLPDAYRGWLRWPDGPGLPELAAPDAPDWPVVADGLAAFARGEAGVGAAHLLTPGALLRELVALLGRCGLAPGLADLADAPDAAGAGLRYQLEAPLAIDLLLLADEPPAREPQLAQAVRVLGQGGDVVVVVAAPRALSRLAQRLPDLGRQLEPGDVVQLPAAALHAAGVPTAPGDLPMDGRRRLLARVDGPLDVRVLGVEKG